MVREAINTGKALSVMVDESKLSLYENKIPSGIEIITLSKPVINKISNTVTPQGILALCALPKQISLSDLGTRVVVLNGVQDSGNVGTIWRTAEAAGFTGLLMDKDCADPFSPKVLRSSMGACFRIPVVRLNNLCEAFEQFRGFSIIATSLDGETLFETSLPKDNILIIIGSEARGIHQDVLSYATQKVKIPMKGQTESLNASVAAAIIMYEIMRR
ncbi:MAG: RNA methyltransferase [Christensenellaceae bacterium]|nr:RNA methyltransferase [Christensenellaceae bacterium]